MATAPAGKGECRLLAACGYPALPSGPMDWVSLDQGEVTEHGSSGLFVLEAARIGAPETFRVYIADVQAGGVLGMHPTRFWQLFCILAGSGWVRLDGEERQPIATRQAVLWAPGEVHESGSATGMTVLQVMSSVPLPHGG